MSLLAIGKVSSWPTLSAKLRGMAYELADCHNKTTGKCHPSHEYLARRLGCTKRTVINLLNELKEAGVITIKHKFKDGRQQSNSYDFVEYRGEENFTDEGENSDTPEGEENFTQKQEEETGRKENPLPLAEKVTDPVKPGKAITFSRFLSLCTEAEQKPIPADDGVFQIAEKAGIPQAYIKLLWMEFRDVYTNGNKAKRYRNWRQVFQNAVRDTWFQLWSINGQTGDYFLTAKGRQRAKYHDMENELRAAGVL